MQKMTLRYTEELKKLHKYHHDECSICKRAYSLGELVHLGFDNNSSPIYVGDCCKENLVETTIRHSYEPLPYIIPKPETILWRYLDFPKYVSMLNNQKLFFCRADKLNDPFEGASGLQKRKNIWDNHYLDFFRWALNNPPDNTKIEYSDEEIETHANRLLSDLSKGLTNFRESTYISCWHESEYESEAMWKIYSKDTSQAIAIKSSYNRLNLALGENPDIDIGFVKYIDFNKKFTDPKVTGRFFCKRKAFEHEREVRAMIIEFSDDKSQNSGISHPVDLDILIDSVIISPFAEEWYIKLVKDITKKYKISKPVKKSEIKELPFY